MEKKPILTKEDIEKYVNASPEEKRAIEIRELGYPLTEKPNVKIKKKK